MNFELVDDIDYEDLDDLPILEHIEWSHVEDDSAIATNDTSYW